VSAGATLSGQAIRTETVSFTLSLAELELWRQGNAKLKPAAGKICDLDRSRGITGNLGLGEWVNSAVHPAETGDLTAGIHTATGAKATAPSVPSPGRSASGSASGITVGELSEQLTRWSAFLDDMDLFLTQVTSADDFKKLLSSSPAALKAALEAADKYNNTLAPYLPAALKTATSNLKPLMRAAGRCYVMESHFTSELTQARKYIDALVESLRGEDSQRFIDYLPDFRGSKPGADNFKKLFTLIHKIEAGVTDKNYPRIRESGYARALMQCDAVAKALNRTVAALPKQIDPPIDAMLHSVTFVISYGANITPNWTLIQWKGPGQSPNLLSGSGVRTHGMVIAIGPPGDSPKIGPDATRLINLQAVRALNQQ
jgi:hypothetical protein